MILNDIESNIIRLAGYNKEKKELTIVFKPNGTQSVGMMYKYYNVPEKTWEEFNAAESQGSYFYKNVRSKFRFKKAANS